MPSLESRLPLIEGAVLALIGVVCLVFQARLPGQLPDEADYLKLQQVLEAEAQPGDAVLLYPWWTERARMFAPERVQVVGYQGSDADALELHPRVWVVAQPELPKADLGEFMKGFGERRTAVGATRQLGHLQLTLYQNGRARPVRFSAAAALASARVAIEQPDGTRVPCQWNGRGHRCPNGEVAVEWHEVRFQPRHCLRFYPPGGAAKLVAEFPSVAFADQLVLLAGYTWDRGFFTEPRLTPTDLSVEVNQQRVTGLTLPPGLEGLQRSASPTPVPEGATVTLSVHSQNAEVRETCVELYGFGGSP